MSLIIFHHPLIIDYAADLIIKANLEDEWDDFVSSGQRSEDVFTRQMRIWFRQQSNDAVNALHGKKSITKFRSEEMIDFQRYQILFEEFGQMVFLGSELYLEVTGKEIPEDIKKYIPKVGIIEKWGQTEIQRLGLSISFDVMNPRIIDFVRTYTFRFSWEVNAETNQRLRDLLVRAFEQGHGIDKTEKNIREMFAGMEKNKSRMIARTEVKRAQNYGAEEAYIQSGVVEEKVWFSARGERTCPFCGALHGKPMGLGLNYYDLGTVLTATDAKGRKRTLRLNYEEIKRPPLHVNCRCRIIAKIEI